MKTLKLNHAAAKQVLEGRRTSTWRMNDDKNLSVNDDIELVDKVNSLRPDTWRAIGVAHVDRIIEKRLGDINDEDFIGAGPAATTESLVDNFKVYYGDSVDLDSPIKMVHFSFKAYDKPAAPSKAQDIHKYVKLYADGGSRGNPGPSASGYALLDAGDNIVEKSGQYLGITTNNQAEYQALKLGLEEARKFGAREIDVYMDSLLVVNQMKGVFKVRNRDLWPIHDAIKELVSQFSKITFTHIPRELNKLADGEVNETLDAVASSD